MDVRCERCGTEYEFDDDRITEGGVTVKCTTCGHVFTVRKAAAAVTVPVAPEVDLAAAVQPDPVPPGGERPKEWKVRQPNGNVFTFQALTTLQKWIVERKVQRDDEISLTGESWKRLGNIGELAAFFQVVDEAQRAAQLTTSSPAPANRGMTPPTGIPPIGQPMQEHQVAPVVVSTGPSRKAEGAAMDEPISPLDSPRSASPTSERATDPEAPNAAASRGESGPAPGRPAQDFDSFSFRQSAPENSRSAQFERSQDLPPVRQSQEPAFAKTDPAESFFEDDEALAAAAGFRKGPSRQLLLILGVVGVVLAAYLVYYFSVWRPAQSRSAASSASSKLSDDRPPQESSTASETPAAREQAVAAKPPLEKPAQGEPSSQGRADSRAPPSTPRPVPEAAATAEGEQKSAVTEGREPNSAVTAGRDLKSAATAERDLKSAATGEREAIVPEQLVPGRASPGTAGPDSRALGEARGSATAAAAAAAADAGVIAPKIARAEPRTFDFYMGQGDRLREREQPQAALEAYKKAAELEPGRAEPLAGRGLALLDLGQRLQAQVWFQQALKLNPSYGVALMGLAEAYRADGKTSDAIRYYEKYLEVLPDGPEASVARSAIKNLQEPSRD